MFQKSSGKIRMPIPNSSITTLLGIRRTPKTNSKDPIWKVRLGQGQALQSINDIPITRHHGNACSISFFSNIETLSAFIYCSCHAKGCLYSNEPYSYIIECICYLTILVQIYMKYIEIYWLQPDPQHKHSKNLAPKRKNTSNSPGI